MEDIDWSNVARRFRVNTAFMIFEKNHCVYIKRSAKSILIISLYSDDILLVGTGGAMIVDTRSCCQ